MSGSKCEDVDHVLLHGTGDELQAMVSEMRDQTAFDMDQLKAQTAELNSKTVAKLSASMEQSRSLKAWREQQNLGILELQVCAQKAHSYPVEFI
jgi:hypothetical protein